MKLTSVKINVLAALVNIVVSVVLIIIATAELDVFAQNALELGALVLIAGFLAIVVIILNILGLLACRKAKLPFVGVPFIGNIVGIVGSGIYLFLPISEAILWISAIVLIVGAVLSLLQKKS